MLGKIAAQDDRQVGHQPRFPQFAFDISRSDQRRSRPLVHVAPILRRDLPRFPKRPHSPNGEQSLIQRREVDPMKAVERRPVA